MAAALPGHNGGAAGVDWDAADGTLQVTQLVFPEVGAVVVDSGGAPVSFNGNFIAEVQFPDGQTGQPSPNDRFVFQYYSDGSVASRVDQRNIRLEFVYDELGRTEEVRVDDSSWFTAPGKGEPDYRPPNRIQRIVSTYEPTGEPYEVKAYTWPAGAASESLVAANRWEYDTFRNLRFERQQHFGEVTGTTPLVEYEWEGVDTSGAGAVPPQSSPLKWGAVLCSPVVSLLCIRTVQAWTATQKIAKRSRRLTVKLRRGQAPTLHMTDTHSTVRGASHVEEGLLVGAFLGGAGADFGDFLDELLDAAELAMDAHESDVGDGVKPP
jgi:hypothetical protein